MKHQTLCLATENAHFHALAAAPRAIGAGDIARAERWRRLSEPPQRRVRMDRTRASSA